MKTILFLFFLTIGTIASAQVAINTDGALPDNSAMLDIQSTDKGILIPVMSIAKRDLIINPANGLLIFCADDNSFYVNRGNPSSPDWASLDSYWATNGTDIYYVGGNMGIGTDNPGAALEISSTTQGFLPPRMTQGQIEALTPVAGLQVFNTTTLEPNYYDGTHWRFFDGTVAGIAIGKSFKGGIVAYILQNGDPGYETNVTHGLIAVPYDQATEINWGCSGTGIPGADGTAIGTGNQNTVDIMAGCATPGIPARLCADLILDGWNDWYLPSVDELNKLYLNKDAIGGFSNPHYWSSSEVSDTQAISESFTTGVQYNTAKLLVHPIASVRCIRSF